MVKYFDGNLLESGCNIIIHQTNTLGILGAGLALQIKERYPKYAQEYIEFCNKCRNNQDQLIGQIQLSFNQLGDPIVVSFFSQRGLGWNVQTDYQAFRTCCKRLKEEVINCPIIPKSRFRIGFPYKIGCGLARGNWDAIKQIIEEEFADDIWNVEIWRYEK